MASFFPKIRTINLRNGVIEKSVKKILSNPKSTIQEKITVITQKLKAFELSNDKSEDAEYAKWLCYLSDIYSSFEDDDSLQKACDYAKQAQDKFRRMHAESIDSILRQIKCNLMMKNPQEIKSLTNYLYEIISFHLGEDHPVLITILESFGDMYSFFDKDQKSIQYYATACDLAKLHIGKDHLIRLRLLKKMSRLKITIEQFEDAFYHMLEVVEIMKKHKLEDTYEMAVILNDTLRLAMDVGNNDIAFEMGFYAQKMYVKLLKGNLKLQNPINTRSDFLSKMIEKYYENCDWMRKLCFINHKSYKFFREFCENHHKIFTDEISSYKKYFTANKLKGIYENRYTVYQNMMKCYTLLSLMLLTYDEKMTLVHIIDRFYFDILRSQEESMKKVIIRATIANVVSQVDKDEKKDPFNVLKKHLDFLMKEKLNLLEILKRFRFKDVVHLYEVGNLDLKFRLKDFRSFVILCGFMDFRNIMLLNLDS